MSNSVRTNTRNAWWDPFVTSLIAGGMAGTIVDASLFPLDTLKTRLQSKQSFRQAGGFAGLYKGLGPVLIGSAPTAAVFFITYDGIKLLAQPSVHENFHPLVHMTAAALGEMMSCLIRVPVEVVKQRRQVMLKDETRKSLRFLYRGYWTTVFRDMPFSLIQFALWEQFKNVFGQFLGRKVNSMESAICGAISGAMAAAVTTPIDVAKTRIMLSSKNSPSSEITLRYTICNIYKEEGTSKLFSGVGPRVVWIFFGGLIFFGVYEHSKSCAVDYFKQRRLMKEFS